jgi:hypothetical protein
MTVPSRGQFILHARAVPPLKAGDYVFSGTQTISGGEAAPYDGHVRIDSPRFAMPPDQILSTFPPANAEGEFENRLPQIVLKRRTLPWDRRPGAGAPDAMPWLALVVVAEGEAQLSGETPVAQCITSDVTVAGPVDVPTSVYLGVSQTVVDKIFPTREDVALLAHVRQVDPSDAELALGDDDGFLAVVMANRLPQYHRATGPDDPDHPVRYLACLVNLEGQLEALPVPPPPFLTFEVVPYVQNLAALVQPVDTDHYVMGTAGQGSSFQGLVPDATPGEAQDLAAAPEAQPVAFDVGDSAPARPPGVSTTSRTASASAWQSAPAKIAEVALSASAQESGRLVRDTMGMGWRYPIDQIVLEKVYRFPVLAHWSFTVTGSGTFETLMQGLDVGLLGTAPAEPEAPPPGTPPAPPGTRPAPELTDTGHVGLPHQTRRGDAGRAWYRGPLTSRPAGADPQDPSVRLPLAHASDQLRRVTPDGREDLSLASAFEIGRLLALSQPGIVAAQLRWRREQFGASRAHRFTTAALEGLKRFGLEVSSESRAFDLGRLVGRSVVLSAAGNPATVLGPSRPLADAGRAIDVDGDVDEIIATGFGFSLDAVRAAAGRIGALAALQQTSVPGSDPAEVPRFDGAAADRLRARLDDSVTRMVSDALRGRFGTHGPNGPVGQPGRDTEQPDRETEQPDREAGQPDTALGEADALDDIIAAADRRRVGEEETP